jgi:hypothetical protein
MHNRYSLDGRGRLGYTASNIASLRPIIVENQSKEKSDHLFLRPDGTPYKTKYKKQISNQNAGNLFLDGSDAAPLHLYRDK